MTNEQMAEFIKDGNSEDLKPLLWERVKNLLYMRATQEYNRRKECFNKCGVELWDLKQCCYGVYIKALEGYKPDKPALFASYLTYPFTNAVNDLLGVRGSKENNKPLDNCTSLDKQIEGVEGEITLGDTITDEAAELEFDNIELDEDAKAVRQAVSELEEPYRSVIIWRYFEDKKLEEIGMLMELSRERVRQIQAKAIRKLRGNNKLRLIYCEQREQTKAGMLAKCWGNPKHFNALEYLKRAERRGEFISYGKRQAILYDARIKQILAEHTYYSLWELLENNVI